MARQDYLREFYPGIAAFDCKNVIKVTVLT
jgi:hypothetical protein